MPQYNLTQRERQQLLDLSKHSKEHFEARLVEPAFAGPRSELARLDFGGAGLSMELTKRDLRVFKDEGLIHFHWHRPDQGTGRLSLTVCGMATSPKRRHDRRVRRGPGRMA